MRFALVCLLGLAIASPSALAVHAPAPSQAQAQGKDAAQPTEGEAAAIGMFRGNPARTGEMPGPGLAGPPKEPLTFKTEGPISASPAVVDGIVYAGSEDGSL